MDFNYTYLVFNTGSQSLSKKDVRSCSCPLRMLIHSYCFLTETLFKEHCESTLLSLMVYTKIVILDMDGVSSLNQQNRLYKLGKPYLGLI